MSNRESSNTNSTISSQLLRIYHEVHLAGSPADVNAQLREKISQRIPMMLLGYAVIIADTNRTFYPKRFAAPLRASSIYTNCLAWSDVALQQGDISEARYNVTKDDGSHRFVQPHTSRPVSSYRGCVTDALIVGDELRLRLIHERKHDSAAVMRVIAPSPNIDTVQPAIHTQIHFR